MLLLYGVMNAGLTATNYKKKSLEISSHFPRLVTDIEIEIEIEIERYRSHSYSIAI